MHSRLILNLILRPINDVVYLGERRFLEELLEELFEKLFDSTAPHGFTGSKSEESSSINSIELKYKIREYMQTLGLAVELVVAPSG